MQADVAAMISPGDFERFVMPDLDVITRDLDRSIYHLDGPGQIAHLDLLVSLENLDGIQWIPGAGQEGPTAPKWFPMLRRIQQSGKLLVLLDIEAGDLPALFDNLDGKGVCVTMTSRDPRDRELVERYR